MFVFFFCSLRFVVDIKKNVNVFRYEQGLEDYEEAVARVDKIKEEQQKQQAYGMGGLNSVLSLIETASNVWHKVSTEFEQKQSTITDKSNDRPTNDFDSNNDKSGKFALRAHIYIKLFEGQKRLTKIKAKLIAQSFSTEIYCWTIKCSAVFFFTIINFTIEC